MAVTAHRWFAGGLRNGDDGLNSTKARLAGQARAFDSAHRSSA